MVSGNPSGCSDAAPATSAAAAPIAPVASMAFPHHHRQQHQHPPVTADPMVDPELMGQGMDELQKMAGEAIAHSTAMQHSNSNEDEEERELRTRLGGFIQNIHGGSGDGGGGGDDGAAGSG
jgi:hypothetical protein